MTPMRYTRIPREGSHRDGPPQPRILVSVVAFEAMQLRGVSKVATLTWMNHGFGLRRAQLLTLNPINLFNMSIKIAQNPPP